MLKEWKKLIKSLKINKKMRNLIIIFLFICLDLTCQTYSLPVEGVFEISQSDYVPPGQTMISNYSTAAYFFSSPTTDMNPSNFVSAGSVQLNGNYLQTGNPYFYYNNSLPNTSTYEFDISGSPQVPASHFIFTNNSPSFNLNGLNLPDTIIKADTVSLFIPNLNNSDSVFFRIFTNDLLPEPTYISYKGIVNNGVLIIPTKVFEILDPTNRAVLTVEAVKYYYQNVSGKLYLFKSSYSFSKSNVVVI